MNNWIKLSKTIEKVIDYRGKTPKKLGLEWSENGYKALSALNVKTTGLSKLEEINYASEELYKLWMKDEVEYGDILLTSEAPAGQVYVWNSEEKIVLSQRLFALRVNKKYNNYFIKYFLQSDIGQKEIFKNTSGSTVFGISAKMFDLINVPDIDLPTQQKIAAVLSALDDKIELNNTINAELEAMAKTLYDYWFVQFEFPNSEGKPYKSSGGAMEYNSTLKREIPKGWEVKRLEELVEVKDGTHDSPKYINDNGYPLVTSKNLKKSGIDFNDTNKISKNDFDLINQRSKVDTGDILFSMIGNIGTIYKVEEKEIGFAIKNVALFKTSRNLLLKNFIFQYLHSYDMQRYLPNEISGSIQKFVGLGSLRNTPILYHTKVIDEFTKVSTSIFERIDNNIKQNQELAQLRDWLLPMLMNGQVKVVDEQYNTVNNVVSMAAESEVDYNKGSQALV